MLPHHNMGKMETIVLCTSRLTCEDVNVLVCLNALKHRWVWLLHNNLEGEPLRESCQVPASIAGLTDMLLSVRSFI